MTGSTKKRRFVNHKRHRGQTREKITKNEHSIKKSFEQKMKDEWKNVLNMKRKNIFYILLLSGIMAALNINHLFFSWSFRIVCVSVSYTIYILIILLKYDTVIVCGQNRNSTIIILMMSIWWRMIWSFWSNQSSL